MFAQNGPRLRYAGLGMVKTLHPTSVGQKLTNIGQNVGRFTRVDAAQIYGDIFWRHFSTPKLAASGRPGFFDRPSFHNSFFKCVVF